MVNYFSDRCSTSFDFLFNVHRNTVRLKTKETQVLTEHASENLRATNFIHSSGVIMFIAHANAVSSYAFQLITIDLRSVVKTYFDRT